MTDVLIAGGGIGGLTAALTLHARGIESTVLERASHLRPLGVGINLLPHAVRELYDLGVGDDLAGVAVAPTSISYYDTARRRCCSASRVASTAATDIRSIRCTAERCRCCCYPHCENGWAPMPFVRTPNCTASTDPEAAYGCARRPATSPLVCWSAPMASIPRCGRSFIRNPTR